MYVDRNKSICTTVNLVEASCRCCSIEKVKIYCLQDIFCLLSHTSLKNHMEDHVRRLFFYQVVQNNINKNKSEINFTYN